jgi:hypothetical protein
LYKIIIFIENRWNRKIKRMSDSEWSWQINKKEMKDNKENYLNLVYRLD